MAYDSVTRREDEDRILSVSVQLMWTLSITLCSLEKDLYMLFWLVNLDSFPPIYSHSQYNFITILPRSGVVGWPDNTSKTNDMGIIFPTGKGSTHISTTVSPARVKYRDCYLENQHCSSLYIITSKKAVKVIKKIREWERAFLNQMLE